MPIRPECKALYPDDWPLIRARILLRANGRCERCHIVNHSVGYRDEGGRWHRLAGNGPCDAAGVGATWPSYQPLPYGEAKEIADVQNCCQGGTDDDGHHWTVIVLTVAHLDHNPANCSDANLAALCQKCHNGYDMPERARGRKRRAEKAAGVQELFT